MSTLNSYFNTRKSRSIPQNEKTLNSTLTSKPFAIQAPQPIYESLPKNTKPKKKLTVFQQKLQQDAQRNSILYYLSPPKKVEQSVKVVEEEEEEDVHTLCKIRVNIPVSHVWNTILEEFDPTSQINQFEDLVYDDKYKEVLDTECDAKSLVVGTRRTRNMLQEDDVTRNVRLRTSRYQPSSSTTMNLFSMDDLYEDNEEVLSRPTRSKHTLEETNDFLLLIADELLILSDNTWIQTL